MITFDVFPRGHVVSQDDTQVTLDCSYNLFTFDGELTLTKVPMAVNVITPHAQLTVAKQTPEPLVVNNSPNTQIVLTQPYDYTPDVSGGLGPYEFSIDGMDAEFTFNTTTGSLSRPPQ